MFMQLIRQIFGRGRAVSASAKHLDLGRQCLADGREEEAKRHLRAAFELEPEDAEVLEPLALALGMAGEMDLSADAARRVLGSNPRSVPALLCLGNVLTRVERFDEAIDNYQQALGIDPNNVYVHYNLAIALGSRGEIQEALRHYRRTVEIAPDLADEHESILFLLNADPGATAEAIHAEHRRWGERFAEPLMRRTPHRNDPDPERPLRIGYVSGDFVGHAASWFIDPILGSHDRDRFKVVCFSSATEIPTEESRFGASWHRIDRLPDVAAAELVESEKIDILVDLSGHTRRNRLLVFARKPAPVQMTMLGYPNTTGFSAMDYRITDLYGDPPGQTEHLHNERLLRLPHCLWCYAPSPQIPPVAPAPCRSAGFVTLASLNAVYKLNSRTLDAWVAILKAAPRARLVVATIPKGQAQARLRARFDEAGIDSRRVDLVDRTPVTEYWNLLHRVDLALDAFPCNGGATTCESLWLGVPTITLAGATFRERCGLSLLTNVGLADLVTYDIDQYIAKATELGSNPGALVEIRSTLRERMRASPLVDARGHTRELEALYREAWRSWCANNATGRSISGGPR